MSDGADRAQRAMKKAAFHLLRAGIETLRAVEAIVVEFRTEESEPAPAVERIEVE